MSKKEKLPSNKSKTKPTEALEKTSNPKISSKKQASNRSSKAKSAISNKEDNKNGSTKNSFPIVGIGASAGGLDAFSQLLQALPTNTGMAFVLIQHLDAKAKSKLPEILSKTTILPVIEIEDGMEVKPNCVYVIPAGTELSISQSTLVLIPRKGSQPHMPIDVFFRSLAQDQKSKAIGVVLSGTASDGSLGLRAIKAECGVTFAQEEKTAKYDGMPRNAILSGAVDFVLPPEKIAQKLGRLSAHPFHSSTSVVPSKIKKLDTSITNRDEPLNKIFLILKNGFNVDFTHYKHNTIKRRIFRRIILQKIEDLDKYIKCLQENPEEVKALYQDILISVTEFFRDPETYDALKAKVFPSIMKDRTPNSPIRIWVPGCSTGEEAYSLAICLYEYLGDIAVNTLIQIFATDINDVALEKARIGKYPESIAANISQERIRRFFVRVEGGYQINKTIRDMCIFARQNVAQDPPFSKIDLISCRNVLIYLGPVLQKKVIPIFHYALKPTGFLMLGVSETIGVFSDLFSLVDKKQKIYSKKFMSIQPEFVFGTNNYALEKTEIVKRNNKDMQNQFDLQKEANLILLNKYAPSGIVIDEEMEIIQFLGHTGLYLEHSPGDASFSLLKMAREGLLLELRSAVHEAKKKNVSIRKEGIKIKSIDRIVDINLEVTPITSSSEHFYLIVFEGVKDKDKIILEKSNSVRKRVRKEPTVEDINLNQLQQELDSTRRYLQSIISEQEETNAELRSANEEILSSNEELQSTNEELETAKEELQATNEELTTVNEELQNRNLELSRVNDDLNNLLSSINIPIIMVGSDLRIRRFNSMAEKVLNVIPSDIGRPLSDMKPNINVQDFEQLIMDVIDTVSTKELEVQDWKGHWYSMRIRPYKTVDNKIDGAVIILVDIDALQRSKKQIKEFNDYIESL